MNTKSAWPSLKEQWANKNKDKIYRIPYRLVVGKFGLGHSPLLKEIIINISC